MTRRAESPWELGHRAAKAIAALREQGRLTETYRLAMAWWPERGTLGLVFPPTDPEDLAWAFARLNEALDVEHPATKGCLLAIVRDAARSPHASLAYFPLGIDADHPSAPGWYCWWRGLSEGDPATTSQGDTEGEALVAALEALAGGGGA